MDTTIFRGAIINPVSALRWTSFSDGGLVTSQGRVVACLPFDEAARQFPAATVKALPGIIIPGFADVHIHWVQHPVRGRFEAELMPWLREHIWPEEAKYQDKAFARRQARAFFADTLRAGTVMGIAYSSVHRGALEAAFEAMAGDWLLGNVVMVAQGPENLLAYSARKPEDFQAFAQGLGQRHYAITPRFALNCTREVLQGLARFADQGRYLIQTHLSESPGEIEEVAAAFPEALDYTDVYDQAGLLSSRSVLGHCIHLRDREWACLANRGSWIAHCPSSNEALDSGRMDLEQVRARGIPYALASDVGGGPSHSMLHVMQRFLDIHRAAGVPVDTREALYRSTLAGAQCMGRAAEAGNFEPGKRADFVLLPRPENNHDPENWLEALVRGSRAELEHRPLGTWLGGVQV